MPDKVKTYNAVHRFGKKVSSGNSAFSCFGHGSMSLFQVVLVYVLRKYISHGWIICLYAIEKIVRFHFFSYTGKKATVFFVIWRSVNVPFSFRSFVATFFGSNDFRNDIDRFWSDCRMLSDSHLGFFLLHWLIGSVLVQRHAPQLKTALYWQWKSSIGALVVLRNTLKWWPYYHYWLICAETSVLMFSVLIL